MVKHLFFILVTLLSGCAANYSGVEEPEELVHIRFSSVVDIQSGVVETTRSEHATSEQSVGILGIAAHENSMDEVSLEGYDVHSLHRWMANDVYYRNIKGDLMHYDGKNPTFPIEMGSAIVAYAYTPHTEWVVCDVDECYIPLDLMADSATTDWMYSGKTSKSKEEYRETNAFRLDFKHAMARLDLVITPQTNKFDSSFKIEEIVLGINNHGKGKLFVENGTVEMDTVSYLSGSTHRLHRRVNHVLSIYNEIKTHIESFYLIPYTEINDLGIVGIWNDTDTISYEYVIADSAQWNSNNLRPGTRSIINVNSIKNNK